MAVDRGEMQEMAAAVAAAMGLKVGRRMRHLVAVGDEPAGLTAMQRDVLYSRIRDLGNMYWLNWLIRQETMHVLGVVECLSDDELTALLAKMERGVEARIDGVAFDEVGLVRGQSCDWAS